MKQWQTFTGTVCSTGGILEGGSQEAGGGKQEARRFPASCRLPPASCLLVLPPASSGLFATPDILPVEPSIWKLQSCNRLCQACVHRHGKSFCFFKPSISELNEKRPRLLED